MHVDVRRFAGNWYHRLKKVSRKLINALFRPASVTLAGMVIAILYLFVSVLGIGFLSDGKVLTLSTTTAAQVSPAAMLETAVIAGSVDTEEIELLNELKAGQPEAVYIPPKAKWQNVRMRVTAYCACRICCGKNSDGRTANMHKIRRGDVFVASDKMYKFGTEMIIPGYNNSHPVEVMDRGRVIKGNRLDVFFNSHTRSRKWGVKYLDVMVRTK